MKIRTRFAPSPTGYVHVGSVRTALYCWLFAKKHHGDYLIRIEDTDQTRKVEGSVENLLSVMKILGIHHDEGPGKEKDCGPYFQSQRLALYQEMICVLLQKNLAYKCFCTQERLEKMRRLQAETGEDSGYDGHCRHLNAKTIEELENDKTPFVIRMRVPEGKIIVRDIVRGDVEFESTVVDDQVLIKSDGFPTYHFANVVDDHFMKITHVVRGEEWLSSTPKHLLLYQAFGWEPPLYAHLPLLLNPDRSKLSKRQGDVAVEDFLKAGYLPEALVNFLALMGWRGDGDKEFYTTQELISEFSLEKISKSGAVFDREKLDWMNAQYLKNRISEQRYLSLVKEHLSEEILSHLKNPDACLLSLRANLNKPSDICEHIQVFLKNPHEFDWNEKEVCEISCYESNPLLFDTAISMIREIEDFNVDSFRNVTRTIQKEKKIKGPQLFMPLRFALSGMLHGPDMLVFAVAIGKQETLRRLEIASGKIHEISAV